MKKLIVALMLLTSLVSCGKNNSVSSNSSSSPSTSQISVTGTVETQLASIIDANQFGTGAAISYPYPETWSQYVSHLPGISYKYGRSKCGSSGICYNLFGNTNYSETVTRTVIHSSVDLVTKQNELKGYINTRVWVQQYSATRFMIKSTNGNTYVIDTYLPIQANPVSITSASGQKEDLLSAAL